MPSGLTSYEAIDDALKQTARTIVTHIQPIILLIGKKDGHFEKIAESFQWSKHVTKVPKTLRSDIALIVTNSCKHCGEVLDRADPSTAVLIYDENEGLCSSRRSTAKLPLACYLASVSDRFLRGHVRILLQLQKYFVGVREDIPLTLTDQDGREALNSVFSLLDDNKPAVVLASAFCAFRRYFLHFAGLTRYESALAVDSSRTFNRAVSGSDASTLLLHCSSWREYELYHAKDIKDRHCVFVFDQFSKKLDREPFLDASSLGATKQDYYLTAYFLSLQSNWLDNHNRTRFMLVGDIDKVIDSTNGHTDFVTQMRAALSDNTLKFRNIPPKIPRLSIGQHPLCDLLTRLDNAVFNELFQQCDNVLENAEILADISRSTLQAKHRG